MKNEKLKNESAITEFDALTDEQLEAVLGGYVVDGKTYTTVFAASSFTLEQLDAAAYCGGLTGITITAKSILGIDHTGDTLYTAN